MLSKLGCTVKSKVNEHGQEVNKTRIILDAKRSRVTEATERKYKSELPRVTDAVHDILALMSTLKPGEVITQLVADITDAFWLIPLHPVERRFFVASLHNKFLILKRTAQGSRTAPLTFAAVMALATRLLQSLLTRDHLEEKIWQDARIETDVDDPWTVLKGTPQQIDDFTCTLLIGWHLLGFPVAYRKASRSVTLKWIGMNIVVGRSTVEVHIPQDKLTEIRVLALQFLSSNVISNKELRSFVGKCMSIASVIYVWKPFVAQFYAALHSEKPASTPKGCTWTSQVKPGLHWILAFLDSHSPDCITKRTWDVNEYLSRQQRVVITWDASPWGFGAILTIDGVIVQFLYEVPCQVDIELLHLKVGDSASQQTMESLAGLIALRQWAPSWKDRRSHFSIRSDNTGALVLLGRLKVHSPTNNIIAREAALDIGVSSYGPEIAEHIPGITNKTCDFLSRIFQPGDDESWPSLLAHVPRAQLSPRTKSWWRSINSPFPASKTHSSTG